MVAMQAAGILVQFALQGIRIHQKWWVRLVAIRIDDTTMPPII
jgi:hypothetical protein